MALLRFSDLSLFKVRPAQIAAGNQPIKVICKIKHKIALRIFPLIMNEIHGNTIAKSIKIDFSKRNKKGIDVLNFKVKSNL
jgi:hypothetical protein